MYKLFLLFVVYSFAGWLMEVLFKFIELKRIVNRGFLVGPFCPIYGFGGLLIYFIGNYFYDNYFLVFFMSIVLCAIMEYLVSFLLEYFFHARWWDYSHKPFNLNGRICLRNLLFFGILGLLGVYVFNPLLLAFLDKLNYYFIRNSAIVVFIMFSIDFIVSILLVNSLKEYFYSIKKDATEEISKKIKKVLIDRSIYFRRVIVAYPNFRFTSKYIKQVKDKISNIKNIKK